MNEIAKALTMIADKLEVNAHSLFEVLVRQASVQFQVDRIWIIVQLSLCGIFIVPFSLLIYKTISIIKKGDEDGDCILYIFLSITCFTAVFMAGIFAINTYSELLTLKSNPQYWALKEIVATIK